MPSYLNGLYTQRGGDEKLRERHAQLIQWASEDGVLDQARKASIPERLGGAFARLTEFFAREEFAVAGVWDVLSGTADEGDTVGGRFVREALGGTKLGNLLNVEDRRSKESFADVLEQRGVGEGGRLSDLIGENAVTKYFDPTVRGTAGLAMSVLFSPSTYLTMGAGKAVKWVGSAGDVARVSTKAQAMVEPLYKARILEEARGLAGLDDLVNAGDFTKLEQAVLSHKAGDTGLQALNEFNKLRIGNQLREEAQQQVVDLALTSRPDLRQTFGLRFAGQQIANLEPLGALGAGLLQTARTGKLTAPAMQLIDSGVGALDKMFQRIPFGARKHEAFRRFEARRHAMRQSSEQMADELLFGFGGVMTRDAAKKLRTSTEANKAFAFFVDAGIKGPEDAALLPAWESLRDKWLAEAAAIGIDENEAMKIATNWVAMADNLGAVAADYNMIPAESFLKFSGRYIPRQLKEEFRNRAGQTGRLSFTGGSMDEFALKREFDTLGEFTDHIQGIGLDVDEAVEWNMPKLMHDYVSTHLRGVADAELALDTVNLLSPSYQTVFNSVSKNLRSFAVEPTRAELELITEALSEGVEKSAQIGALKSLRPEVRAAYLYEAAARTNSLEQLGKFFDENDALIKSLDVSMFAEMRRAAKTKSFDGMAEVTLKKGPFRDKPIIVPEGVAHFFQRNETTMQNRMPEELQGLLKKFDILQNTFKRTHTVLFPSFHIRNMMSNTAAMAVETNVLAMMNPTLVERTIKLMANHGGEFTMMAANGRRYTNQELRKLLISLDIIPSRMVVDELTGEGKELLARVKVLKDVDAAVGKTGQTVENFSRAIYFLNQLERGVHPMDAAMQVKKVLFDYGDLSFTQREVIRRAFPFATWTMKNVELQVKNLATKPGRVGALVRTGNAGEQGPEAELLPEYMRGEMKVRLADQPGKAGTFLTGLDMPINNIDILWAGGVGKTMREQFGMFTPIIKAPLEYMLNLDTFTGQPIKGRRWLGQMGPVIQRSWPKKLQEFIELEEVQTSDGRTLYKANGTKMWLISKNLFLGRLFNESVTAAGMAAELADGNVDEGMKMLVRTLTGMRFTEMDLTDAQKQKLITETRAIEQYLVERGSISEFTRTFRPKSKQQQQTMGFFR